VIGRCDRGAIGPSWEVFPRGAGSGPGTFRDAPELNPGRWQDTVSSSQTSLRWTSDG